MTDTSNCPCPQCGIDMPPRNEQSAYRPAHYPGTQDCLRNQLAQVTAERDVLAKIAEDIEAIGDVRMVHCTEEDGPPEWQACVRVERANGFAYDEVVHDGTTLADALRNARKAMEDG